LLTRLLLGVVKNGQGLVDQDSQQPTPKLTFAIEARPVARCSAPAVTDGGFGSIIAAKYPASDEMKSLTTA
jgi:hypothetical protein